VDGYYSDGGALAADPNNNSIFWSGGHYTFAMFASKSTNSGSGWTRYYLEPIGYVYALAIDPNNSSIVYAGGDPGVYRTTNAGTDWTDVSNGLTDVVMELAIDPFSTTTLYAATRDGVFKTTNSGGIWTNTGCSEVSSLILDPNEQGTIYCATTHGVNVSTNAGGTWADMNTGLGDTNVTCIRIDPGTYLFIGTMNNGLYRWQLNTGCAEEQQVRISSTQCNINPNPVTDRATITYQINVAGHVLLSLYSVNGRLLRTLCDRFQDPGTYSIIVSDLTIPAGIYFVRLQTCKTQHISKFIYCE
jgi:hypothetical protein